MKSLLNALKEGRLVELPDADKEKSLERLARLFEAIPGLGMDAALKDALLERERAANTGLGQGVACPHVRTPGEGDLLCAAGWSPTGIDYGAPDGRPVRLVLMYLIPDSQKNAYLREVCALATTIHRAQAAAAAGDIAAARERLLDWASSKPEGGAPEAERG